MGTVMDLLPFLNGWEYEPHILDPQAVAPDGTRDIAFAQDERGWILGGLATMTGANLADAEFSIRIDAWVMEYTIGAEMVVPGFVQRGVVWPYLTVFAPAANQCSAAFEFPHPMPYKSFLRVSVKAPTQNGITLEGKVATIRIMKTAEAIFLKSLRDALDLSNLLNLRTLSRIEEHLRPETQGGG